LDSDFPAESAARFPPIVGICIRIQSRVDGNDDDGADGDVDDGDGDDGDGNDGDGDDGDDDGDDDGVSDGDHSTRST
jgi:hypothetical protein